ncbi:retrograde regulation protein 2 [Capronia epimyces CBS 606.96]|uniref:Retrograde regulation protein 2 n=1 Tax=Capronia epimyces CBS 606.96 TaxID=1182542 RepID=W9YKT4_9EURO|nr:retrograde regulation protein 2 [Capronia epimyces CBS 606.96]EXJ93183.1 retrograde regulation protein 2 [Capronia epimyces CBS 606.96]
MVLRTPSPSSLYGLVDMGSNGIRFSVTDLSPPTARCLPTLYQDREGISLFDAQYSTGVKGPIPQETIDEVLSSLLKFKTVCADFGVPETNIRILATEATRTAANSEDFRQQIRHATGWEVNMLPKEAEGRIGAMGVASSFASVEGLVMDLGGGSTQITWMMAKDGKVETSPKGSISFPYGAAALTRQLAELSKSDSDAAAHSRQRSNKTGTDQLEEEMKIQFSQAYDELDLPDVLKYKAKHGGLTLYLSGGGFRGWGYLLMSKHKVSPYPIPIINGFQVVKRQFQQTAEISALAAEESVFRISNRRAAQVPAVAFLVNVLVDALPMITQIRFCQGGVREGFLFDALDTATKVLDPLSTASAPYGTPSAGDLADLLSSGLPGENDLGRSLPATFTPSLVRALSDMMYLHLPLPKESRAVAALHVPLTGVLASAHGISHTDRALLALALCARWDGGDGSLPPPYTDLQARLCATLTHQEVFWAKYLGALAGLVGVVYPAGRVDRSRPRLQLSARWAEGLGKKGLNQGVVLHIKCRRRHQAEERRPEWEMDAMTAPAVLNPLVHELEKIGKKKNRVGGEHGYGVPIEVEIERVLD